MYIWDDINAGSNIDLNGLNNFVTTRHKSKETNITLTNEYLSSIGTEHPLSCMKTRGKSLSLRYEVAQSAIIEVQTSKILNIEKSEQKKNKVPSAAPLNGNFKPFRAYQYVDEYRKRKEKRMKQLEKDNREKRIHVAKPMPNFAVIHAKNLMSLIIPQGEKRKD